MARVGDPGYLLRLTDILQTRDPMDLPLEVAQELGITVAIPAELLLAKARRSAYNGAELKQLLIPNPAAGANWTVTVPPGKAWLVRSIFGVFAASATVIGRRAFVVATYPTDPAITVFRVDPGFGQLANQTVFYTYARGIADRQNSGDLFIQTPFPDVPLIPGSVLQSLVLNIQVGDDWTSITAAIEEFNY